MPSNQREVVRMRHARHVAFALAIIFTAALIREVIGLAVVDVARDTRVPMVVVEVAASAGFWLLFWLLRSVSTGATHTEHARARR